MKKTSKMRMFSFFLLIALITCFFTINVNAQNVEIRYSFLDSNLNATKSSDLFNLVPSSVNFYENITNCYNFNEVLELDDFTCFEAFNNTYYAVWNGTGYMSKINYMAFGRHLNMSSWGTYIQVRCYHNLPYAIPMIDAFTIEFNYNCNNTAEENVQFRLAFKNATGESSFLQFLYVNYGGIYYQANASWADLFGMNHDWIHVRVDVNRSASTAIVFVNDAYIETIDASLMNDYELFRGIDMIDTDMVQNIAYYLDDYGNTLLGYEIGSNTLHGLDSLEVDRWEFALKSQNLPYAINEDFSNLINWNYVDGGAGTGLFKTSATSTIGSMHNYLNRKIELKMAGTVSHLLSISKNFTITDNATYELQTLLKVGTQSTDQKSLLIITLRDMYGDYVSYLHFEESTSGTNYDLYKYDGGYIKLVSNGFSNLKSLDWFNVSYYQGNRTMIIKSGGTTIYNTIASYCQKGLSQVQFTLYQDANPAISALSEIDSVKILNNNDSLTKYDVLERGMSKFTLNNYWNSAKNFHFKYVAMGRLGIHAGYQPQITTNPILVSEGFHAYNSYSKLIETSFNFNQELPNIYASTSGTLSYVNNMSIFGFALYDGTNAYIPEFSSGNVNGNETYFETISGRLHFTLKTDDTELEYTQLKFNINPFSTTDRGIVFNYQLVGTSQAFMRIGYTDETNSFLELKKRTSIYTVSFPEEKFVNAFYFLATDADNDINSTTTGYFSDIYVREFVNLGINISLTPFFDLFPALLTIVIVPLIFYSYFGRRIIAPVLLIVSIILFATAMIPLWIFFIFVFSFLTLALVQYARPEQEEQTPIIKKIIKTLKR